MAARRGDRSGPGGLVGLLMLAGGLYLLTRNIVVGGGPFFGYAFASAWGVSLTSGYALIPLMAGIGLVFFGRPRLGGAVTLCSAAGILFGVVAETRISLRYMDLFDLTVILTLIAGGFGLLLRAYQLDRRARAADADIDRRVEAELRVRLARTGDGQDAADRLQRLRNRSGGE